MAPMGSIRGTMPQDIVLIFMCPCVIAPTAAKMEKRIVARFTDITPVPTGILQGETASLAPKFHAIKNDSAKPIISRTEFASKNKTFL
ncbi:MAG: hypothetical protein V3S97_08120 [Candidatus Bathyarchaeia archaeon]